MDNIPRRKMPFGLIEKSPKILKFKREHEEKKKVPISVIGFKVVNKSLFVFKMIQASS